MKKAIYSMMAGLVTMVFIFNSSASATSGLQKNSELTQSSTSFGAGEFTRSSGVASTALTSTSGLTCSLNATNVHMSTSTPGSFAADAIVTCHPGISITINSVVVTLHKAGLIPHYLTGPNLSGAAYSYSSFYYNAFKTICTTTTSSVYWSTAHGTGVYSDGTYSVADATSPQLSVSCGTSF